MGKARKPFGNGKLFGARETTPPAVTRALPITFLTSSRLTMSPRSGSSVHFASNSSTRPPVSTTKSASRVRSRQKKRPPERPARRSRSRSWAKSERLPNCARCRRLPKSLLGPNIQQSASGSVIDGLPLCAFEGPEERRSVLLMAISIPTNAHPTQFQPLVQKLTRHILQVVGGSNISAGIQKPICQLDPGLDVYSLWTEPLSA